MLESLLIRDPADIQAHLVLGGLDVAEDRLRAATVQALAAAAHLPDDPRLIGDVVAALMQVGELVEVRRCLDHSLLAHSESAEVLMRTAAQRQMLGEHETALALIERARETGAHGRDFDFYRAVQLAFNGRTEEAVDSLERCIAASPPLGRAYLQLARMRKQTPDRNHLAAIEQALTEVEPGGEDHAGLEFAHYKELEDFQRYDEAWGALTRANHLMYARLGHDPARESSILNALIEACPDGFAKPGGIHHDGPQPIFVIGMPRSGTTVLDRILGNHSRVKSAGELGDFSRLLGWATDHCTMLMPDEVIVDRLGTVDWAEVGRLYLQQTQWRAQARDYFVDKLPRNWMLAGLIHAAVPRAPILHMVRDPMDVCFSNYRALFGDAYPYSYDMDALARHYREYRRLMAHWHEVLPGVILDVDYGRLVREPDTVAREVLGFCGLEYEPGCSDLTRNDAPVATLSMSQVREPIHTQSFGEWRPYATHLGELDRALSEFGPSS